MFSPTSTWGLLRVTAGRVARGLAAVEPRSLVRDAQRNAASAVASADPVAPHAGPKAAGR